MDKRTTLSSQNSVELNLQLLVIRLKIKSNLNSMNDLNYCIYIQIIISFLPVS